MKLRSAAAKTPPEMNAAPGAEHKEPGIAGKPGVLFRLTTKVSAADDGTEAADIERHAGRVGEGVVMCTQHKDSFALMYDDRSADSAVQPAVFKLLLL